MSNCPLLHGGLYGICDWLISVSLVFVISLWEVQLSGGIWSFPAWTCGTKMEIRFMKASGSCIIVTLQAQKNDSSQSDLWLPWWPQVRTSTAWGRVGSWYFQRCHSQMFQEWHLCGWKSNPCSSCPCCGALKQDHWIPVVCKQLLHGWGGLQAGGLCDSWPLIYIVCHIPEKGFDSANICSAVWL